MKKVRKKQTWIGMGGLVVLLLLLYFSGAMAKGAGALASINIKNTSGDEKELSMNEQGLISKNPFGEHVYIFSPKDDPKQVQKIIDDTWALQETNQFGEDRVSYFFLPGEYDKSIEVKVGYYTQVSGLGLLPTDTVIPKLTCDARWLGDDSNHNATCNFWRGIENITMNSDTMWAVSQATFMRRVQINGSLYLHDNYGWASGGFLADSKVANMVDSGSQQQWLSRNADWDFWMGENWNMVFVGVAKDKAPKGTWPGTKYTSVNETPIIQEKPFLYYDSKEGYSVFVPEKRENAVGVSWDNGVPAGKSIGINQFYIASPDKDTADTLNAAMDAGKNLLLTPGIYKLDKALEVKNADTIILGMGLATLTPTNGNSCVKVEDEDGVRLAGILFDAGEIESDTLLLVGEDKTDRSHSEDPITLSDLFFRVGGAALTSTKVKNCVTINSNDVIGDNFWVWRADHGSEVAWDKNTAPNGIIINGDRATFYALLVEHFQEYQTIWNGNAGRTYFYQCEIPYDVPNQKVWMSHDGMVNGFASYKVANNVTSHEAWGLGIYSFNRDAVADLNSAMEIPDVKGVKIHNICTVMITGNPGISHVINESGEAADNAGERRIITEYEDGIIK